MNSTKENILLQALHLFAADGYEAVSVSRIAEALGITKGALYKHYKNKHYKNKRDIFNNILIRMEQNDLENAKGFDLPEGPISEMEEQYESASFRQLVAYSKAQFRYWTQNDFALHFRRMLTLEQYRSKEMGQLYQQYLVSGPVSYLSDLFGSLHFEAPQEKAVMFYAPMFLLYSIYDGAEDPAAVLITIDACLEQLAVSFLRPSQSDVIPGSDFK